MNITKVGHCCLIIETKGKRIMTDPGSYTVETHSNIGNIDCILFTHEHQDHFHLDSLKVLMAKNPNVVVYANSSVSGILEKEGITHVKIVPGKEAKLGDVSLVGIGEKHAPIHSSIPLFENTGLFIDGQLWYPGDSFTNPERAVDILALPVAGPWTKISDAADYALLLKPRIAFAVHDHGASNIANRLMPGILSPAGTEFVTIENGETKEF